MEEIQYQRNKLKMNLQRLKERSQQNHLLESVVKDYEKYEKHMREQDEAHYKQMVMIQTYLEDIMETNQLTESGLNQLEHTHANTLAKLDEVKQLTDGVSASPPSVVVQNYIRQSHPALLLDRGGVD